MGKLAPRAARMFDRLRIGVTLMALAAGLWVIPALALLLPAPAFMRWGLLALLALAEAFLLGVYMHDGDGLPPYDGEDGEYEPLPYGGGRQA
jgi:hypothetical protein